ncbi:MAG: tetratricopeptide repeat protein [Bacteroidota bacterium]
MENKYTERIDQFLDGELSAEEHNDFEQAIEQDAALESEVMKNIVLREAIAVGWQDQMRSNIQQWRSEPKVEVEPPAEETTTKVRQLQPKRSTRTWMRPLAIAASFLLLISVGTFLYMPSQYSNEAIASRYYTDDSSWRSGTKSGDGEDPLDTGITAYEAGNYEQAVNTFSNFPDNDKAIYGLAQSQYQLENYSDAISNFQKVIARSNPNYLENAEWYLLLTYLKSEETGRAFDALLEKIIDDGGFYAGKAKEMKGRLDSFWRR